MGVRHWTEDDFLNRAYGVGEADSAHLDSCAECSARWTEWQSRRTQATAEPELSHDFLAAQRRAIYRRLNQPTRVRRAWAPAFAAMLMVLIGLFLFRPGQQPVQPLEPVGDDAVFAEVYSLEQSSEPAAVKPIQALFEV